jgi:hypothetical protein
LARGGEETAAEPDAQTLFLTHLPTIEAVVAQVSRHHHLRADERDEFSSRVKVALLDRDAKVLRQHDSSNSMAAYLRVVISRFLFDYRNEVWGRWRPSAAARRQGPVGVLLERLIVRDGLRFDTAVEVAQVNHGVRLRRAELWEIFTSLLPVRVKWRPVAEEAACAVPSREAGPDVALLAGQRSADTARILASLDRARLALQPEDQLILRMRIDDGWPVSRIATTLGLNQRELYRRVDRLYRQLRNALYAEGISSEDVREYFGQVD